MRLTGPPFVREVRRPMSTARMLAAVTPQAVAKRQGYIREWFAPGPMTVRQRGLRFEPAHIEAGKPGFTCTLCSECLPRCRGRFIQFRLLGLSPDRARACFVVLMAGLHASFLGLGMI